MRKFEFKNKFSNEVVYESDSLEFHGMNLTDLEISDSDLSFADFTDCCMRNVEIKNCNLSNASFIRSMLMNAVIKNSKCCNSVFKDALLYGCRMENCDFHFSDFADANVTGAVFTGSDLSNVNFLVMEWSSIREIENGTFFRTVKCNNATIFPPDLLEK